jgi:hypothetical protein
LRPGHNQEGGYRSAGRPNHLGGGLQGRSSGADVVNQAEAGRGRQRAKPGKSAGNVLPPLRLAQPDLGRCGAAADESPQQRNVQLRTKEPREALGLVEAPSSLAFLVQWNERQGLEPKLGSLDGIEEVRNQRPRQSRTATVFIGMNRSLEDATEPASGYDRHAGDLDRFDRLD